jgi:hypothetical protein
MLITVEWLQQRNACHGQVELFKRVFPNGSKLTLADCRKARRAGLDRMWTLCHLLAEHGLLQEFIVFTLKQHQPALVALLQKAGLSKHAQAAQRLDWQDLTRARAILDAARSAAWLASDAASLATRVARDAASLAVSLATRVARDAAWLASDAATLAARVASDPAWLASDAAWVARDAAWLASDAAWDEQVRWTLKALAQKGIR